MKGKYNINYTGSLKIIRTPLIYFELFEIYPLPNIQILKKHLKSHSWSKWWYICQRLKVDQCPTLTGCHFGQGWRKQHL